MMDFRKFEQHLASHPSAQSRLDYGSFVSLRFRYLYIETPKVACTSIKMFIHLLEGLPPIRPFLGPRESKLSMFIHDRQQFALPSLLQLDQEQQIHVLTNPKWFRFALVRNPYGRLFSAWYSKIRMVEPDYECVARRILPAFPAGPLPTFHEFVAFVCDHDDLSTCDAHWCLQSDLVLSDHLDTVNIFKLEDFSTFWTSFAAHLQSQGYRDGATPAHRNENLALDWRDFYDAALADRVFDKYRRDFERFGYSRDSWEAETDAAQIDRRQRIADLRSHFEQEVFERNRTISALYSLMPTA